MRQRLVVPALFAALFFAPASTAAAQGQCYTCNYELDPTVFRCLPTPGYAASYCVAQNGTNTGSCTTGAYDCGSPDYASAIRPDGSKIMLELRALAQFADGGLLRSCSGQLLFSDVSESIPVDISVIEL